VFKKTGTLFPAEEYPHHTRYFIVWSHCRDARKRGVEKPLTEAAPIPQFKPQTLHNSAVTSMSALIYQTH